MRVQRKTEELAFEQTDLEREVVPDPVSASRDRNRAQTPRPWSLPLLTRSTVPYPLSPHIEHERVLPPGSLTETVSHVLASVAPGPTIRSDVITDVTSMLLRSRDLPRPAP